MVQDSAARVAVTEPASQGGSEERFATINSEQGVPDEDKDESQRGTSSYNEDIVNRTKSKDMHHGMNEDRGKMENQNDNQKQYFSFLKIDNTLLRDQNLYWNDLDTCHVSAEYNYLRNLFTLIGNRTQNGQSADPEGVSQPPATAHDDYSTPCNKRLTSKYRDLLGKNEEEIMISLWKTNKIKKDINDGVIPRGGCHFKPIDSGSTIIQSAHQQTGTTTHTHNSRSGHDNVFTSTTAPATRAGDTVKEEQASTALLDCSGSDQMSEEGRRSHSEERDRETGEHCTQEPCLSEYKDVERSPKTVQAKQDINNNPRHWGLESPDAGCSKEEDVTILTDHSVSAEMKGCREEDLQVCRHSQGEVPPERRHSDSQHVVSGQSEGTHESDTADSEEKNANCSTQNTSLHSEVGEEMRRNADIGSVLEQEACHVEDNSGESVEPDTKGSGKGGDSREHEATVTFGTQTSLPNETTDRKTAVNNESQQLRSSEHPVNYITQNSDRPTDKENWNSVALETQTQTAAAATHAEVTVGSFPEEHTPEQRAAPRMDSENSVKKMPDCDMDSTEIRYTVANIFSAMRVWQECDPTSKIRGEIEREDSGDAVDDLKRDEPLLESSQQASKPENPTNRCFEEVPSETDVSIQPFLNIQPYPKRPKSEKRATTNPDFKSGQENRKSLSSNSSRHVQKHTGTPVTSTPTQSTARSKIDTSGVGESSKAVEKAANVKSSSKGGSLEEVHPTLLKGEDSQDSHSPALPSQSENSSRNTADTVSSEAVATEPEPQGADGPRDCRSGGGGVSGRTPEHAESRGSVCQDDSPSDVAQSSPPGRLQEDEDEHTGSSADTSLVHGGSVTLSTDVQPQRSDTARTKGCVEHTERLKNADTVQNMPESEKTSHPTPRSNGLETNTGDVSVEDSPTEQQPTSGKGRDDDNETASPFVRAGESAPTGDPNGMQTEEAQREAGSANDVPESHSYSDSGDDLYSETETGDSRPMELPFYPLSEIERAKERYNHSYWETPDPSDPDSFRKAREKLLHGGFDKAGQENGIHSRERRGPVLIMVSLANARKSKHSSMRTDERTQPFSTSDMHDLHADSYKKIQQFSLQADTHQRFEETLSKRRRDEEDIGILWRMIHNFDRFFHGVVVTLPFFPRDFPPVGERMRLESMRLASFHSFPHENRPSSVRLANAGFFYTGQGDSLACHFCGLTFRCDSAREDPYALHRTRSPECPFVRGTESGNLHIQDEQRQALSGRDITGDESNGALVSQQVQVSRGALDSSMTSFLDRVGATTNQTAATTDTVQVSEPLTVPSGDDSPTAQTVEARCTLNVGNTNTPLSPGPRTNESGYFSANGPLSEPRSGGEQGQSLTTGDLQNRGLDSATPAVTTAAPGSEASLSSGSQAPPQLPPEDGATTTAGIQTRNSSSPLGMSHGLQGPSSSTSQRHQSGEAERRSENPTTSTRLNEARVEAGVLVGASGDPVIIRAAVSSPPPRSEGVAQLSHLAARPLPQMVFAVTESAPTLVQDHQAERPAPADSSNSDQGYHPTRALHKAYTDLGKRERSFLRWPDTHGQSPEELAVAGFFYTGIGDCVRCHYCGLGLKDWDPEDRAMDEHVRWRSSCGYLQAILGPEFIAKTFARLGQRVQGVASARSETSESVAAGLASQTTGVGGPTASEPRADNSDITREADTLMTSQAAQAARAMGFPDDVIRQSIVALLRTTAGRNAVRDQNVIHTILYLRERGQVPEVTEPPAEPNDTDDEEENTSRSTSANSSPQHRTLARSPAPSDHNNPAAVQPAVSQGQSGPLLQVFHVSGQYGDSRTSLPSTGSSTLSSSSSSSSSSGRSSLGNSWSSGDSGFASGSSSEDETSNGHGSQRPSSGCSTRLPTIREGTTTREDLRRLEQENLELMERRRCKICLDNDVSILFLPCGHLVCCGECATALRRCPMCRKRISGTVHTKLASAPPSTHPQGPG